MAILSPILALVAPDSNGGTAISILLLVVYFLPTLIAGSRKRQNKEAIGILNLLLGWTILGWIVCLIWAITTPSERQQAVVNQPPPTQPQPISRPVAAIPPTEVIDNLERLVKLKEQGVLTEQEFQAQKAEFLGESREIVTPVGQKPTATRETGNRLGEALGELSKEREPQRPTFEPIPGEEPPKRKPKVSRWAIIGLGAFLVLAAFLVTRPKQEPATATTHVSDTPVKAVPTVASITQLTDEDIRKQNDIALARLHAAQRPKDENNTTQATPATPKAAVSPQLASSLTWTIKPVATRDPSGGILISASTNIPDGLKIWVELADGSTSKTQVSNGNISSEPFTRKGKVIPTGPHRVSFLAYFNEFWQQPSAVTEITGKGGKKLNGKLFHKTDPDVIDSDKMLEYSATINFPPVSRELEAISLVKSATLVVDGTRSSGTIGEAVDWSLKPGTGIYIGKGWKAVAKDSDTYEVQLDITDAANDGPAIWEADMRTKKVRYINKTAKDLSYIAPY